MVHRIGQQELGISLLVVGYYASFLVNLNLSIDNKPNQGVGVKVGVGIYVAKVGITTLFIQFLRASLTTEET